MKTYGVKAVSKLSGVSVRTLHHYDKIGLLKPFNRTEAGYRHYGEDELLRLQQVLFYKELGFPLKEIIKVMDDPAFKLVDALKQHKSALNARKKRISHLLLTIDKTISHLEKGEDMSRPEFLYEGLSRETATAYREGAMDEYGKEAVARSEKELAKLGKEGFKKLQADFEHVNQALFALKNEAPEHANVQLLIARHYECIRKFWGTSNSADRQAEAYAGLGQLYVSDERFTAIEGEPQPEFALFLQRAMAFFAQTELA